MAPSKENRRRLSSVNLGLFLIACENWKVDFIEKPMKNKKQQFEQRLLDTDKLVIGGAYPWHLLWR